MSSHTVSSSASNVNVAVAAALQPGRAHCLVRTCEPYCRSGQETWKAAPMREGRADVEGWTGDEGSSGYKNRLFYVYEATYEKR